MTTTDTTPKQGTGTPDPRLLTLIGYVLDNPRKAIRYANELPDSLYATEDLVRAVAHFNPELTERLPHVVRINMAQVLERL